MTTDVVDCIWHLMDGMHIKDAAADYAESTNVGTIYGFSLLRAAGVDGCWRYFGLRTPCEEIFAAKSMEGLVEHLRLLAPPVAA